MIQHRWTAICHDSSVDLDSNNITLYRIFAHLQLSHPRQPDDSRAMGIFVQVRFHVVTCWGRTTKDGSIAGKTRTTFIDPHGEELMKKDYDVDLTHSQQHHHRIAIAQLPLTHAGQYNFRVDRQTASGEWERVTESPLDVEIEWIDPSTTSSE